MDQQLYLPFDLPQEPGRYDVFITGKGGSTDAVKLVRLKPGAPENWKDHIKRTQYIAQIMRDYGTYYRGKTHNAKIVGVIKRAYDDLEVINRVQRERLEQHQQRVSDQCAK